MHPLVLTSGEPAGIGPDLCVKLAQESRSQPIVVLGDRTLLKARAQQLGVPLALEDYVPGKPVATAPGRLSVLHLPLAAPVVPGQLDAANAPYVLALMDRALAGCLAGEFAGLVTAPVHKGVINDAGIRFQGHTEYLQEKSRAPHVVMMLAGGGMRVALATTHHPLRAVPDLITRDSLTATLRILAHDLKRYFTDGPPRILVAGLNPHAGESGHLGREEMEVIIPVLEALRTEGLHLTGPLPADTLFRRPLLASHDCVLAMYHDQGLPVLKYASFGAGVNVTLGLPCVRTSVDHGTALDLAGTGAIDVGSLRVAIDTAAAMALHAR
ncbi:4-hydroxythreonine-4-phosphate dehydrogenase PdxA [Thiobacter aerophilum]|uniref:4-hydroxythreonine-4-phosphate dehydrogenase n=1 Tax=Thiobacter aerophilum TaxID=3121275 RepID=A0ABV0EF39_9BURK